MQQINYRWHYSRLGDTFDSVFLSYNVTLCNIKEQIVWLVQTIVADCCTLRGFACRCQQLSLS